MAVVPQQFLMSNAMRVPTGLGLWISTLSAAAAGIAVVASAAYWAGPAASAARRGKGSIDDDDGDDDDDDAHGSRLSADRLPTPLPHAIVAIASLRMHSLSRCSSHFVAVSSALIVTASSLEGGGRRPSAAPATAPRAPSTTTRRSQFAGSTTRATCAS